ncbi:MAG: hypothetical protein FD123_1901 [Bacteroidetes bacterium]|nr:MAG: hypothetical protein FD123_1901 [Bacteroidota bacterium]
MKKKKRVLVAPLDWGLGHATRCVPVIRALLDAGAEVLLAADGRPGYFLRDEFPKLEMISLPGYNITYPENGNMLWHFALSAPGILKNIRREHGYLQKIIEEKYIDIVISDNRFGLWSEKAKCIYITHQLNIKAPAGENLVNRLHRRYMKRFSEIWVPDFPGKENLSGELGHGNHRFENIRYIGPLTRFSKDEFRENGYDHEILAVLSGPEPQRTLLEEILLRQLPSLNKKTMLVRGVTETNETRTTGNMQIIDHLPSPELEAAMRKAEIIICRPGYSTLCDLAAIGKKAICIPTPGQTEQEYLAKYHAERNGLFTAGQADFDYGKIVTSKNIAGSFLFPRDENTLRETVESLLL